MSSSPSTDLYWYMVKNSWLSYLRELMMCMSVRLDTEQNLFYRYVQPHSGHSGKTGNR